MGFIDFTNGEVLTADQMDTVMRQGIMRFADASARDTALSAVLAEGMMAYLDDTNEVLKYDGSQWVAIIETADDVITTEGDIIIGDASGAPVRLPVGSADQVLTSDGTTVSFQDASGGGNYTLITSGTLNDETLSITNIPQDYTDLILEFTPASSSNIFLRINDVSTSDYDATTRKADNFSLSGSTGGSEWSMFNFVYMRITLIDYTKSGSTLTGEAIQNSDSSTVHYLLGTSATFNAVTKIESALVNLTGTFNLYGKNFV